MVAEPDTAVSLAVAVIETDPALADANAVTVPSDPTVAWFWSDEVQTTTSLVAESDNVNTAFSRIVETYPAALVPPGAKAFSVANFGETVTLMGNAVGSGVGVGVGEGEDVPEGVGSGVASGRKVRAIAGVGVGAGVGRSGVAVGTGVPPPIPPGTPLELPVPVGPVVGVAVTAGDRFWPCDSRPLRSPSPTTVQPSAPARAQPSNDAAVRNPGR